MSRSSSFWIIQQNISSNEDSAVLRAILLFSFIEHVFAYRTSIAQRMLLCTLFFSQQIRHRNFSLTKD